MLARVVALADTGVAAAVAVLAGAFAAALVPTRAAALALARGPTAAAAAVVGAAAVVVVTRSAPWRLDTLSIRGLSSAAARTGSLPAAGSGTLGRDVV